MAKVTLVKRPPPPNQQATVIRNEAKRHIRELVEKVAEKHRNYVGTWENNAPDFSVEDKSEGSKVVLGVLMEADAAEQATLSAWQLLDRGTDVRYMQVSWPGWESKTWPEETVSGIGNGITLGLDIDNPRRGIEKREIAKTIAELFDADGKVREAYKAGFEKNFK